MVSKMQGNREEVRLRCGHRGSGPGVRGYRRGGAAQREGAAGPRFPHPRGTNATRLRPAREVSTAEAGARTVRVWLVATHGRLSTTT